MSPMKNRTAHTIRQLDKDIEALITDAIQMELGSKVKRT